MQNLFFKIIIQQFPIHPVLVSDSYIVIFRTANKRDLSVINLAKLLTTSWNTDKNDHLVKAIPQQRQPDLWPCLNQTSLLHFHFLLERKKTKEKYKILRWFLMSLLERTHVAILIRKCIQQDDLKNIYRNRTD